jgi:Putative cell wall-binding domain
MVLALIPFSAAGVNAVETPADSKSEHIGSFDSGDEELLETSQSGEREDGDTEVGNPVDGEQPEDLEGEDQESGTQPEPEPTAEPLPPANRPSPTEPEKAKPAKPAKPTKKPSVPKAAAKPKPAAKAARLNGDRCDIPLATYKGHVEGRIGGTDRFATNAKVASAVKSKPKGNESAVFIANANDFADGLSMGALAQATGWPIFLVNGQDIPDTTFKQIKAAKPTHVYVAGGTKSISESVVNKVKTVGSKSVKVTRFSGKNRYETSAKIAGCFPKGRAAFLVNGTTFADAVVAAGPAAKYDGAIILTEPGKLHPLASKALKTLSPKSVEIVGSKWTGANISKVKKAASVKKVPIYSGKDRYETSAKVAKAHFEKGNVTYASGATFPDALSGIAVSEVAKAPIVLTKAECRPDEIKAATNTYKGTKVLLGGKEAVTEASYTADCAKPGVTGDQIASVAQTEAAKSLYGYDCSGFVGMIYGKMGISIPRTSWSIWSAGRSVAGNPQPGDIAIMNGGGHVAIYLGMRGGVPWIAESPGMGRLTVVQPAWGPILDYVRF